MATPVFDQLFSHFTDAQAAGYARGRVESLNEVLTIARAITKPSRQVLTLIEQLEKRRYEINLKEKTVV